jgi:serine/threonine protein kinase
VPGYAIDRRIGRGGMGEVFQARRLRDGREVALKLMRPEMGGDAEARAGFLREIDVMARLRHPHIVAVLDRGSAGDAFFLAMEYCAGGSLSSAIARQQGPLPEAAAVRLGLQVLDALADAHARGFVHRDIKPENVLLADEALAVAKLADFGLAKSFQDAGLSGMTATGAVAGTPQFMPREQLTNFRLVRPSGDVWSLAATLYHVLTLDYPREFPFGVEPLQVILEGPIVPLRDRRPDLPAKLGAVIDKGLADDVAVRYPDAQTMRAALRGAL